MTWSWSPFALMLTMGVQIPRFRLPRRSLEVWILRTTALVSILASTLVVTTCRASPILAQPEPHHESHLTVLDSTNLISKGLFDDYDSHQDVPAVVGELHAVDTRHLHHRGLGLRKKASQLSLAFDGMTLIGFAYTEAQAYPFKFPDASCSSSDASINRISIPYTKAWYRVSKS
ncbi:hypothetical protein DFH05DRAFT_1038548 [Lentinula detonsa]|uniref:Uncharacterized protein n=1 Tax=Lentinula detonsa TaxID=2804962 RepID=A0A9W8P2M1_9AGAR|nr:hypothetical protein DFH05DRAFT_1038548 [Lentinula detonsa]